MPIVISQTTVKKTYTESLFYALVTFLKKWVKIKNDISIRKKEAYITTNKPPEVR